MKTILRFSGAVVRCSGSKIACWSADELLLGVERSQRDTLVAVKMAR
jgi:hypothetical protein